MDGTLDEWAQRETVDIETRAIVSSLVSAVGGTSIEQHGRYVLGDDALACLKDLRRWIKHYDERVDRLDVKRVLAESNLVKGDLLEIISSWAQSDKKNRLKTKVSLKSVELLVSLTWPIEIDDNEMKVNHHRHIPYLRLAQIEYKRAILHHDVTKILRAVIELTVPYMVMARDERAAHDEGIIRLALILFRNIALTEQPKDLPSDGNENEVSRSTTIEQFQAQGVFQMMTAIASSIGEEYIVQDVLLLELLFHTLKGIDPEKLFMEEEQIVKNSVSDFKDLVQKEKSMLSGYKRYAPSRHNRFGTLVSLDDGQGQRRTVSGQEVIHSTDQAIQHMDKHKKWNKPKHRGKRDPDQEREHSEFNKSVTLSQNARKHLKRFISEFLDSSFNPLFSHCRKALEREDARVMTYHWMQYFYLIGWFLKAECARRQYRQAQQSRKGKEPVGTATTDDFGFSLVASVLNQETFVLLNRYMELSKEHKEWKELNAGMTCFTQILLTVQQMSASNIEDDQEIAENIQNRIFYEESTHERVIHLLRSYKDQGFGYLDACTELSHVFIRLLETYSKQNVDLQIRSRRRQRRKQKAADNPNGDSAAQDNGDEAADIEQIQIVSRERKFDFTRFVARFLTQQAVNTFVAFTKYYHDLSKEQLKRAHRFFYRVAFKNELSVLLFRVDIIRLFQQMVEGQQSLDTEASYFVEWRNLAKQLFRRLIKKMEERPGLAVELLFSKVPATVFYLEHGYDNVVERAPRPPAELEVRPGMEWEQQVGVAVNVLINQSKSDALAWLKKQLSEARDERQAWQDADEARKLQAAESSADKPAEEDPGGDAVQPSVEEEKPAAPAIVVKPDNDERKTAMFKDNKLRLLMKLCGFQRLSDTDDQDASWLIPSGLTAEKLQETLTLIGKFEFDPPTYEDGKSAESFLRSSAAASRAAERRTTKAAFDDESDDGIDYDEEIDLGEYGAGDTTARKPDWAEKPTKKRRLKKRRKSGAEEGEDDPEALARREAQREKRRLKKLAEKQKFKSTMFVHDSDEESDEERDREFFAAEELRRKKAGSSIAKAMAKAQKAEASGGKEKGKGKKRKSVSPDLSEDEEMKELPKARKKSKKAATPVVDDDEQEEAIAISSDSSSSDEESEIESPRRGEDAEMTDTPISSQAQGDLVGDAIAAASRDADTKMTNEEDDEEDALPVRLTARKRGGFVIESDDED